ncbi:MAG: serine/threonine-protein phosphatase [Actinobacteria bacterium]|nr:serine/threonine-protein phosphatase [Actinomycetota bacterium]
MSRREPFKKLSLPLRRYALSVIAVGAAVLIAVLVQTDFKTLPLPAMAIAILLASAFELMPTVHVFPQMLGEDTLEFALNDSIRLITMALFGYAFAALVVVASILIGEIAKRRTWYKALYNLSEHTITTVASGLVYLTLSQPSTLKAYAPIMPYAASALVYILINSAFGATLTTLKLRTGFSRSFASIMGEDGLLYTAQLLMGLAAVHLYRINQIYSLIVLIPHLSLALVDRRARRYLMETRQAQFEFVRAGEVQKTFMPAPVERDDLDIAYRYIPHANVSGDFFDIFQVENEVHLAVGDAMGKGVPAALIAASHHQSLRFLVTHFNTSEILELINRLAYERTLPESFLSMFCARYNAADACLYWSNAGHPPPIFYNGRTGGCRLLMSGDITLGAKADAKYSEKSLYLFKDDVLVLYTDGATESVDLEQRQFGIERLLTLISKARHLSAEGIANAICESVDGFSGGHRSDDLTVVVLKVKGPTTFEAKRAPL